MSVHWHEKAQAELFWWVANDRKAALKIEKLILDIQRNGLNKGLGKPEPLKGRKGWSRRIDEKNRLIYDMDENGEVVILACKGHYED